MIIFVVLICLKLNCWVCEMIVVGILWGLVVVKMNMIFFFGFFNVFNKVLKVFVESICILLIMYILYVVFVGV